MQPGDTITLAIDGLALDGAGLGTLGDREISVYGAFPGETVEARVEHVSRQHARAGAKMLRAVTPHAARVASPCPDDVTNGGRCNGCPLGALDVEAQREAKRAMLSARFGIAVESVVGGDAWGYRASSKRIAFRHGPRIGLGSYVRGTHYAASMQHCRVDHPRIAEAARELETLVTEFGIDAYDEKKKTGVLRAAWFKTDGERVLVTLVLATEDARVDELAKRMTTAAGVSKATARADSNDLRGTDVVLLRGVASLATQMAGERVELTSLGFLQPNPAIAGLAYADLTEDPSGVPCEGALAFDLYAGVGVTTRILRKRFHEVAACESYPESAKSLGIPPTTALDFLTAWKQDRPESTPSLVVANPPRAGLGGAVRDALVAIGPAAITMMSCHPGTLGADIADLTARGYRLVKSRAYDTLPGTPHVEMVVWLTREAPSEV